MIATPDRGQKAPAGGTNDSSSLMWRGHCHRIAVPGITAPAKNLNPILAASVGLHYWPFTIVK